MKIDITPEQYEEMQKIKDFGLNWNEQQRKKGDEDSWRTLLDFY